MMIVALKALAGIAASLSLLMALAWVVQRRTGNSGWVDTIWTFPPLEAQMLRSRGDRYRDYQSRTSAFFPLPPQKGVVT
jgi:steroid 5-alpha reductase family enzyme